MTTSTPDVILPSVIEIHPSLYALRPEPYLLRLLPGSKAPVTQNGLKDAVRLSAFEKAPEQNYGIRLDGFVCADFDCLDFGDDYDIEKLYRIGHTRGTWAQETGGKHRGVHFLFALGDKHVPTVSKIQAKSGNFYGEIKSGPGGYIVGPNSFVETYYKWFNPRKLRAI